MKPIDKLMDCNNVRRWNLVCTTRESNVADHSFNVAMLALALRKAMFNTAHIDPHRLSYFALMHDVDESETGDLSTPTKAAIRAHGADPNRLFVTQGMEEEDMPPDMAPIIKMADLIENYTFILEYGVGTRALVATREVKGRLDEAIDEASTDLAHAAREVLSYVLDRKSESDEERDRFARNAETTGVLRSFNRSKAPPVVG